MRSFLLLSGLALLLPALPGCDAAAELLGVDAFDVPLGDASLPLLPADTVVVPPTEVSIDERLPDVFDVADISIPPDAVHYEPAGAGGGVCRVRFYVTLDAVPILQSTIELDEGATEPVQSVTSRYARPYDRDAICADVEGDCPVATRDRTEEEIRDHVDRAVDRRAFEIGLLAATDGPCAGLLEVERLHFRLDF